MECWSLAVKAASKFHPGDALLETKSPASPQSRNTPILHHSATPLLHLPVAFRYSLAVDNFSTSSFVSFTSTERNKGGSCSGIRALAIGATTVG
jgi:hypothetical protein